MNTTRKTCPQHPAVFMTKTFELALKADGKTRWVNVTYYCRVCSAAAKFKQALGKVPKS